MKKWKILLTVMMIAVCLTGCNKDIGTEGEITPGNSEEKMEPLPFWQAMFDEVKAELQELGLQI